MKRCCICILCILLCLSLTGCAGVSAPEDTTAPEATPEPSPVPTPVYETAVDISRPVLVEHLVLGDPDAYENWKRVLDAANVYLVEKINTFYTFSILPMGNRSAAYAGRVASGEPLDLVDCTADTDIWQHAEEGCWLPLDDLLPVCAPLTWVEIPAETWDAARYNGQILCVPGSEALSSAKTTLQPTEGTGVIYRGDWADKAGVGSITDFDGITTYLEWIRDTMEMDVYPFLCSQYDTVFRSYLSAETTCVRCPAFAPYDYLYGTSYEDYTTLTDIMETPAGKDYFCMMSQWSNHSLIGMPFSGDWSEELFLVNQNGMCLGDMEEYKRLQQGIYSTNPGCDLRMFLWRTDKTVSVLSKQPFSGVAVCARSLHPERALLVLETLWQDETFFRTIEYGIEGWQYVEDGMGRLIRPEGYTFSDNYSGDLRCCLPEKFLQPALMPKENSPSVTWSEGLYLPKGDPYGAFSWDFSTIPLEDGQLDDCMFTLSYLLRGWPAKPELTLKQFLAEREAAGFDAILTACQRQLDAFRQAEPDG